jgi:uncharacterized protein
MKALHVLGRIFLIAALLLNVAWSLDVPALTGRVNDTGLLLSSAERQQLESFLADYESKTSNQLVLLTIPSLEGESLEAYSIRVVEKWKIGQKDKNNGLLMLVSKADRAIRIEVGYGLEGKITDAFSGYVIREVIVPAFRAGSYYGGIYTAFDTLTKKIADEFTADQNKTGSGAGMDEETLGRNLIVLAVVTIFLGTVLQLGSSKKKPLRPGWAGMIVLTLLALIFFGPGGAIFILAALLLGFPYGFIAMFVATIFWALVSSSGSSSGGGGFGGSSGGGFSGGGGSFGGGGSSGRW